SIFNGLISRPSYLTSATSLLALVSAFFRDSLGVALHATRAISSIYKYLNLYPTITRLSSRLNSTSDISDP
ncbi:hypothetical protein V2W45_1245877, partial [Cenococcum geophilum]